mgnify:CR=1 FL=1
MQPYHRGGRRRRPHAAFALLMALVIGFPAAAAAQPKRGGPPPKVVVTTVSTEEVNPPDEYVGRVEAVQAVDLRARVRGYLEEVAFEEGAAVAAGDLLYRIEQAPYQAAVNKAEARAASAEAALDEADRYLRRLRAVRSGGVSATDLDAAVTARHQAKARRQEAEADLTQARLDLDYATVTAPIDGRIGRTAYTRGNLVGPDSGPLARIVQMDPIRVVYSMSETELAEALTAQRPEDGGPEACLRIPRIRLPNGAMYPEAGRIDFVDNTVNAATGTIAVRAAFDNPDGLLIPGQYVTALVRCREGRELPVVPQSAVQEDRKGRYVFVVDDNNKVRMRRIETGPALETRWAVTSGLSAGETLIVSGVQKVRAGQTVDTVTRAQSKDQSGDRNAGQSQNEGKGEAGP